jgi:GTP-binding protein
MKRGDLVCSALTSDQFPRDGRQEVALLGRSNSGKSSLLNALLGMRAAHVSSTPGRTQRINFFWVDRWYLVDLPGFGYAKVPLHVRAEFSAAVDAYLEGRQALTATVLIQDIRRDPEDDEMAVRDWARHRNVLLVVAANKADKLGTRERDRRLEELRVFYGPAVHATTALRRQGLAPIREALGGLGLGGLSG